jgi:hypothetical protein
VPAHGAFPDRLVRGADCPDTAEFSDPALGGNQLGLPGAVFLLMFLGGAVLGTLTLAAMGVRRSCPGS